MIDHKLNKAVLFILFLLFFADVNAQSVTFRAAAPNAVVKGEQFRLQFIANKEGRELRIPEIKGFEILYGPAESSSFSQQTINGKTTSQSSYSYTYILVAQEEGTFTIPPASITIDGSNYKSNELQIKVLPPDKKAQSQSSGDKSAGGEASAPRAAGTVSADDAFIRAIISKNSIYEQEGFSVTFRLYTTLDVVNFGKIEFPEFEGFMVEEIGLPANQQLKLEHYNGRNYYTADLKKSLLFPQRSGKINIPSGHIEMVFSVPSGRRVTTFFGSQEVMADVKKAMVTNPVSINVLPLPAGKPDGYANAVGNFSFKPSISTQQLRANEAITVTIEISGTGNLKLIRNPQVAFPTNFETYDPTVTNTLNTTANGLSGTRKIEYLAIPRYEGSYTIPPVQFSYFDTGTKSYKTLSSPEYNIQVAKGDPTKTSSSNYVNQQDVKVEQDIRFLKTETPEFQSTKEFFAGSFAYWLWYIAPALILFALYLFYKKQARENANIALTKTKKANKTAIKRLKAAKTYLKENNKEKFYDETLRALWGYFSDKLSIPAANLSRENIEAELSKYGIADSLVAEFMNILNTCEFARYAPGESAAAMDHLYNETLEAIAQMESKLKK
ncbi:MAG: BatD family protein [Dysgonamonadaceae bacterium]|jgi:hypothetical protein|nr:BatD family protein [Dysgonamonadaceae bacterium]